MRKAAKIFLVFTELSKSWIWLGRCCQDVVKILVGISTSWVILLTSSKFTLKRKLASRVKLFYFENAVMAFKVLIAFILGTLQYFTLKPSTIPSKKERKVFTTLISSEIVLSFSTNVSSSFSVFNQWNLVLLFSRETYDWQSRFRWGYCRSSFLSSQKLKDTLKAYFC